MAGNTSSSQPGDAIAAGAKPKRASAIMRFSTKQNYLEKSSEIFSGKFSDRPGIFFVIVPAGIKKFQKKIPG
ncbi:hypothetical protein [Methanoregula sp.]|uniref:hypothetical protein n=1 Tax=Methanoregula sp. TaxID=2052170 RepID=UPI003C764578